jgi:prevent-host-death family protein
VARTNHKSSKTRTVGIKELKDQASGLIDSLERNGQPIVITRNHRRIARLVPFEAGDGLSRLRDLDLIAAEPQIDWKDLGLQPVATDAHQAIAAVLKDRGEEE